MANLKQIKTRVKSVKNLQKIVNALEIVSTVKLQKLKGEMTLYKDFMQNFLEVLNIVRKEINLFKFDEKTRNPKWRRLLIVVTWDKWLCGSMNSRIFKRMESNYWNAKDNADVFVIWKKWVEYFVRNWRNVVWNAIISDKVLLAEINPITAYIRKAMEEWKYSKIKVYFNFYKNTMNQVLTRFKLYPLDEESFNYFIDNVWLKLDHLSDINHKYLMVEPDIDTFRLDYMLLIIRTIIYSAILHNKTTEYAARMLAMKNAKDNCTELLWELNLLYNKTRQGRITQEITEIVSAKTAIQ